MLDEYLARADTAARIEQIDGGTSPGSASPRGLEARGALPARLPFLQQRSLDQSGLA
jgi:hypothetical protein